MSRGWSFLGGVLLTTSLLFINLNSVTHLTTSAINTLRVQQRKIDELRSRAAEQQGPLSDQEKRRREVTRRVSERVKKMWNSDIEKAVRRVRDTNWQRLWMFMGQKMRKAGERISESMGRLSSEESKKST